MTEIQSANAGIRRVMLWSFICFVCFVAGVLVGNEAPYYNRQLAETKVAHNVIESSLEFHKLKTHHSSQGQVGLSGTVPSQEALAKLEATVIDQFGRMYLQDRLQGVRTAGQETDSSHPSVPGGQ